MTIYSYKCMVCGILGNSITEGPQMCPKCKAQDEKRKASRKTRKDTKKYDPCDYHESPESYREDGFWGD